MSDPMTNSSRPIRTANLLDPRLEALEPAQKVTTVSSNRPTLTLLLV